MPTEIYTFSTAGNYTYDSSKIEVTGGVARLKDQRPANALCAGTFASSINLNWGNGTLTGTATGGATITGGKLDLSGGTNKYVTWSGTENAKMVQTGTVKFRYWPKYNGSPAAHTAIYCSSQASGGTNNGIYIQHNSNGNMTIAIYDANGNALINTTFGSYTAVADTAAIMTLCFDLTTGATRWFIDGVQKGSTNTTTGTRSDAIGMMRMGDWFVPGSNPTPDFMVTDLVIYDNVQYTANHTAAYTLPATKYPTDNPYIDANSTFITDAITSFSSTIPTPSGSDLAKIAVKQGVNYKYYNGSAWANSTSYSQTNTGAEVASNITTLLGSSERQTIGLRVYLHSDDGSTTPSIDEASFVFDIGAADPTMPTSVYLTGYLYDRNGPVANQIIKVRPYEAGFANGSIFHFYEWETFDTTNSEGYFNGYIYESASVSKYWEFKIGKQKYYVSIPNQALVSWSDLEINAITE